MTEELGYRVSEEGSGWEKAAPPPWTEMILAPCMDVEDGSLDKLRMRGARRVACLL